MRQVRCRLADEGGFSLPELMVAMVIMVAVAGVAFAGLNSVTTTSYGVEERNIALAETRGALELIIRDLRAANPINPRTPVSDYDAAVDFDVYCSAAGVGACGADNFQPIEYRVAASQLVRTTDGTTTMRLGPSGPASLPAHLQRGAIVNDPATEPVFTYFDANGTPLVTQGATAAVPTTFQNCARSVRIHLVVRAESNNPSSRVDLETTVDLRNYHEVSQCTP